MHFSRRTVPISDHFDGQRFRNPDAPQVQGFADLLRWQLNGRREKSPRFIDDVTESKPASNIEGDGLAVTLINHSTLLLQHNGANILTDPVWSQRVSPFQWIGPRRRRKPGVRLQDLPPIDIVLLSHNHYDHLDLTTVRLLARRAECKFVAPLGLANFLRSEGVRVVHEMDWWESVPLGETLIHSVPALHFSARGLFDRNRTLWCGYGLETKAGMIYFAGDTAFGKHFSEIRQRRGPPRLALLPIGSYQPEWFMSSVHMSPDDAIRAHGILDARHSIAIHHGTFQLGDDGIDRPRMRIQELSPQGDFRVLNNGEAAHLRG